MVVPSAVVNCLVPVYPEPSFATTYTYATLQSIPLCFALDFLPEMLSMYLTSKSSAVALETLEEDVIFCRAVLTNVLAVPSKSKYPLSLTDVSNTSAAVAVPSVLFNL